MKMDGQLGVVEYSRITVPDSVHMGDPAVGYVEMLKARNSARAPDGLGREASYAGVSEGADGEL